MNKSWNLTESDKERVNNRKHSLNISEWKDKKRKILKDSGQKYISNRGKGKEIPEKTLPTIAKGCGETCMRLSIEKVHSLHGQFYKLTYNEQNLMLLKYITLREPTQRRTGKTDSTSRKMASFIYSLDGEESVCKKTLCHTFSVTPRRIQVLQNKMKMGELVPKDGRGLHTNRLHAVNNSVRKNIVDHINSFPREVSHYSRNVSSKECLFSDLSVKKMYRLFKLKYPAVEASVTLYRKIFKKQSNLRFGSPRTDTCKVCDQLFTRMKLALNEGERSVIQRESSIHHMKADQGYKTLADDGKNPSFITLCVDLQQVLFTPTLTHSDVYYQRQYSSYNLAIHNMSSNHATMFLWHEALAKRGAKEIASCILKYLTSQYDPLPPGKERKLIVWSDRCCGQNNNWTTLSMYQFLITSGYFSEIHQKFMTTGHSFLPCDRDFALIERKKKVMKAFVPGDWKYVIGAAKVDDPFTIIEMDQKDFKNLDVLSEGIKKKGKFLITKFVWFKIAADDPSSIYARESHNTLRPWTSHQAFDPRCAPISLSDLPSLYSAPLPISKEKKKDLVAMSQFLLKEEHKSFYQNLHSA